MAATSFISGNPAQDLKELLQAQQRQNAKASGLDGGAQGFQPCMIQMAKESSLTQVQGQFYHSAPQGREKPRKGSSATFVPRTKMLLNALS